MRPIVYSTNLPTIETLNKNTTISHSKCQHKMSNRSTSADLNCACARPELNKESGGNELCLLFQVLSKSKLFPIAYRSDNRTFLLKIHFVLFRLYACADQVSRNNAIARFTVKFEVGNPGMRTPKVNKRATCSRILLDINESHPSKLWNGDYIQRRLNSN